MTLLLYAPRFYPALGGLEKVTAAWAGWLHEQGHTVVVLTQTPDASGKIFPYPVMRQAGWWQQYRSMRQADVVVQFDISLKGLPVWWLSRKPLVISHHTGLAAANGRLAWRQQLKLFCSRKLPLLNTACSQFIASSIGPAVVVPSPFDASVFTNRHLPRQPWSLLYVGRLVSVKGVAVLLHAMAKLLPSMPQARLTILGEGPELPALQTQAAMLGITASIIFGGKASAAEVANAMATHQVLVVPSLQEPFGTVVLEGLSSGCVVVTSTAGGLPQAGGPFTLQVPPGDALALATALQQALEQPKPADSTQLAAFLNSHTVDATAALFLTHIQQALAAHSRK